MFIEEILKVDELLFAPQSELKPPKYEKLKIFDEGWQNFMLPRPPKNSSREALNELKLIQKEYNSSDDETKRHYINCDEDASYYIKEVLRDNNFDFNEDTMEMIEDQCRPIIKHYKNHYNRPRPYQLADALNIEFKRFKTETSKTPSYPSGHTVQPYVVANHYGNLYPEVKQELRDAADICAYGRVQAGLHYPSDYKAGIILADHISEFLNLDNLKEDAPLNSTGDAVQSNHPLVRSKSLYKRKNEFDTKRLYKLLKKRYN